jgi:hypothetical protein
MSNASQNAAPTPATTTVQASKKQGDRTIFECEHEVQIASQK